MAIPWLHITISIANDNSGDDFKQVVKYDENVPIDHRQLQVPGSLGLGFTMTADSFKSLTNEDRNLAVLKVERIDYFE